MKLMMNLLMFLGLVFLATGCADKVVYVRPDPPPQRVEVIGVAPYPKAVWIKGGWEWRRRGYVWRPGHWRRY